MGSLVRTWDTMGIVKQHKTGVVWTEDQGEHLVVADDHELVRTRVDTLASVIYDEAVDVRMAKTRALLAKEHGLWEQRQARAETLGQVSANQQRKGGKGGRGGV